MNAEHYALRVTDWQLFVTLTFKKEKMRERDRVTLFFRFARTACKWFRIYFPRLKWALRLEQGEKAGRWHFHVLMAGLPENAITPSTCFALSRLWASQMRVGWADVREWEAGRDAVSYVLKDSTMTDWNRCAANAYESAKFGGSRCLVMLSESVLKAGSGDKGRGGRHSDPRTKG